MGDWCGPSYGAVTTMIENQGAELRVTLLGQEEKPGEHEKIVHGEVQLIDTSLLMGAPNSFRFTLLWILLSFL
jgi:hypothetical protein